MFTSLLCVFEYANILPSNEFVCVCKYSRDHPAPPTSLQSQPESARNEKDLRRVLAHFRNEMLNILTPNSWSSEVGHVGWWKGHVKLNPTPPTHFPMLTRRPRPVVNSFRNVGSRSSRKRKRYEGGGGLQQNKPKCLKCFHV